MKMGNIVTETNHMLYNSSVHKMILFVCSFAGIKCEKPSGSAMSNSQMIKWTVHPSKNNIKKQQQQPPGNNEQNLKNFSAICKLWRYAVFLVHFFSLSANFLLKCTKFEQVVQSKWQYFPFVWNSQYTKSEWYGVVWWCGANENRKCPTFVVRHRQFRMVFTAFFFVCQWIGEWWLVGWSVARYAWLCFHVPFASSAAIIYV